jgi:ABC-2 type transport system ATP-binding protein
MSYLVEARGLTKYVAGPGKDVAALREITLDVNGGEIFGLIGPNGAGKTTLLKTFSTLILPSAGYAGICGRDVVAEPLAARKNIGLVSGDERSFYWRLSGRENLEFFASFYNLSSKAARSRIEKLTELVEISEPNRMVGKYSSGMRQRLALARGLLHNPPVLLMDEPTRSLDPGSAVKIRGFVKEYLCRREGRAIIWATHNLEEAEQICDRIGMLRQGRLIAAGTLDELREKAGVPQSAPLAEIYDVLDVNR